MPQSAIVTDLADHSLVKTRTLHYHYILQRIQHACEYSEVFSTLLAAPVRTAFQYLHGTSQFGSCWLSFALYETEEAGDLSVAFLDQFDNTHFHSGRHFGLTFEDQSESIQPPGTECEFLWLESKTRDAADRLARGVRTTARLESDVYISMLEKYVDELPFECRSAWIQLPWVILLGWTQLGGGVVLEVGCIDMDDDHCFRAKVLTEGYEIDVVFNGPKLHRRFEALLKRQAE